MKFKSTGRLAAVFLTLVATAAASHAADATRDAIKQEVDAAVTPLMAADGVPGMAVGIIANGKPYVFNYGVASIKPRKPVTDDTLFELGSVSKTLTATLTSYAAVTGHLTLTDKVGKYLPALANSAFGDKVSLLNLGTHTPGGFPLQVPDYVQNNAQLLQYFAKWQPTYTPGTYRTYANPSIGALGLIAAKSMGQDFDSLMEKRLFPALGMTSSYIDVPPAEMPRYAEGYTKTGSPIRMAPGVLGAEAYGVRTNAADMLRFLEANMNLVTLDGTMQRAINETHTGYYQAGPMTQDLIWEQYPYPADLKALLEGNLDASPLAFNAKPATALTPPEKPLQDAWLNKTGSTNGFGAYVAFVPGKQMGIVLLANKNLPIPDRVRAAYTILTALAAAP